MTYDVIVVGAGPAGTAAARDCAQLGLSTLCIEEHGTIGYPVQCAGLLSDTAFLECRVTDRCIMNRVQGARIVSSAGSELLIDAGRQKAVVVDRGLLDREMAKSASDAGAEFLVKTRVSGIQERSVLTRGVHGGKDIRFRILIAADGPKSMVARMQGLPRAKMFLAGAQADMLYECDPRFVTIYPDASPDFFGWMIPESKNRVRVGLCSRTGVQKRFDEFAGSFGSVTTNLVTGTIPLGVMQKTYGNRTMVVGDAAGFAKPTSGGGIYTGIRSARHAAAVAVLACEKDRYDETILEEYEKRWKADIGRELSIGFRLLVIRQKMSPEDTSRVLSALNNPSTINLILENGDMDRLVALVRQLVKKPVLFSLISPLLKSGTRSLLG